MWSGIPCRGRVGDRQLRTRAAAATRAKAQRGWGGLNKIQAPRPQQKMRDFGRGPYVPQRLFFFFFNPFSYAIQGSAHGTKYISLPYLIDCSLKMAHNGTIVADTNHKRDHCFSLVALQVNRRRLTCRRR